MHLELGVQAIRSYKRLPYTAWHALAEFVDNSTQSYMNHRETLDTALQNDERPFEVSIAYDKGTDLLRIADNAMGMSLAELEYALRIGQPPADTSGRSKYGLGMKMAACWFGEVWSIRTKRLGETVEHEVTVRVEDVALGDTELPYIARAGQPSESHYTIIEVSS
jgi:Histidine kinase-, DNA gyrase B-, and HSP90-like ATPase